MIACESSPLQMRSINEHFRYRRGRLRRQPCCRWLSRAGHDVWVYDNLSVRHRAAVLPGRLIVGELTDEAKVLAALKEHSIEAVTGWVFRCVPCALLFRRGGLVERGAQGVENGLGHFVEVCRLSELRLLHLRLIGEVVAADTAFLLQPQDCRAGFPCDGPGVVAVRELDFV